MLKIYTGGRDNEKINWKTKLDESRKSLGQKWQLSCSNGMVLIKQFIVSVLHFIGY